MLRSTNEILNYVLLATDDELGRCKDFLFDDRFWTVRYMVADTRKWLPGRKVLVSPSSLGEADWASRRLPVRLPRETIESAPPLDEDAPVSRQDEARFVEHFDWPVYWAGGGLGGPRPALGALGEAARRASVETAAKDEARPGDPHLRSTREVTGYDVLATDGEIGRVKDFIVDDAMWTIRYLVVDTGPWLTGRKVLVAPTWVEGVDWSDGAVDVALSRRQVEESPGLITILTPQLGYETCSKIAKESYTTGRNVYQLIIEKELMSEEELDEALKPDRMIALD